MAENNRIQITHAIGSGDFIPADSKYNGSWIEFWEDKVSSGAKNKYEARIKNLVGAHVIGKNGNVYIMPCENAENAQQGNLNANDPEKLFLSVPEEALAKVSKSDTSTKSNSSTTWGNFIQKNRSSILLMQYMDKSDFQMRW